MRGQAVVGAMAAVFSLGLVIQIAKADDNDGYLRGYISAVAERELNLSASSISVKDGVVHIIAPDLSDQHRQKLLNVVGSINGVAAVQIDDPADKAPSSIAPAASVSPVTSAASQPAASSMDRTSQDPNTPVPQDQYKLGLLPGHTLFDPLIADPRWPHIAGTYRAYQQDKRFSDTGAAEFGGSLSLYRFQGPGDGGLSEIGLQAAVFSSYNLNAESHDLINADYFVALSESYRLEKFSVIGRIFHQSSHIGDEYLLDHPGFNRINLSYEQVDVIGSYDLSKAWRLYAGAGWLFDQDPVGLDPWSIHYGLEYKSPTRIGRYIRPVAAIDFQHKEREDWDLDLSVRAGIQIEGTEPRGDRLLLLAEYYTGHDPNGQFYDQNTQWYGLGLHWFY